MDAIVAGDFEEAARWVVADQQGALQALGLGRGPGTTPQMSGTMKVAAVNPTGEDTSYATFVGTMCRTAPAEGGTTPSPECLSNDDPDTDLPYFIVQLIDTPEQGWQVHFQPPTE
ncbi:hypothetical protein [Nocardioides sp. SYSU DS0651]|uniref:hypothetical protein n=1 Tax=Nocardioides sp. SYSU DS0651 TaxID=3415955 RepID=UPI003F4BAFBD